MEEQLSLGCLNGPDPDVAEEMVFLPIDTIDGKWVTAAGKLIAPACEGSPLSKVRRALLVQHGLPGDQWRMDAEEKARKLAKETGDISTLLLMPGGLRRGTYKMGIGELGGPEADEFHRQRPFFFEQPFSFERYTRALFAAMKAMRRYAPQLESMHIAGHSYGALAALYALRQCAKSGMPPPDCANFLSPFVQVALDTKDPDIALRVINTRVAVDESLVAPGPGSHIGVLKEVLSSLPRFYHVTQPQRNPIDWHMRAFGARFFGEIGDLTSVVRDRCRVRVFRGEKDPYIDESHGDLIARRIGSTRTAIETVLPEDGHSLESLDLRALVAT
ncbi:hypothetical protein HYW83_03115 [Candidatus Peregrinibacteria bacterium]|nr:hypothetical protein [Candidatus Peregrinibacteria bacterium]